MTGAVKLTEAQDRHLQAFKDKPRGAYPGLKLNVLNALHSRGLIHRDASAPGCFFTPQVSIRWSLTPAGRAALDKAVSR